MPVQLRMLNNMADEEFNPSALLWALQSIQLFMFGPLSLKIATGIAIKSAWNSEKKNDCEISELEAAGVPYVRREIQTCYFVNRSQFSE